jgi:hypothetical protein
MGKTTMKMTVVTTFHDKGYKTYGKKMIETFLQNWPDTVSLVVYAENCEVVEQAPNLIVKDLHQSSPELVAFKERWKDTPKAIGKLATGPINVKGKQQGIGFKWDAVRFAHKTYSIFDCARNTDSDFLIWMDADTVCHSPVTVKQLNRLIPQDKDLCFLGRRGKYTECGLYAMNLKSPSIQVFLNKFQWMYDDAENGIFKQDEWHDSFIFDVVRKHIVLNELDWSSHLITGEGHPLINSEWGAYLDHLKGDRKTSGRSKLSDLKIQRNESYWLSK